MAEVLFLFGTTVSLAATVRTVFERHGSGRFPIFSLLGDRFSWGATIFVPAVLGFFAGSSVVIVPAAVAAFCDWIRFVAYPENTSGFFVLAFLTFILKILWAAAEELIFRGAVLVQAARYTNPFVAVIFSAAVFAIVHMERTGDAALLWLP